MKTIPKGTIFRSGDDVAEFTRDIRIFDPITAGSIIVNGTVPNAGDMLPKWLTRAMSAYGGEPA